jgi:spermidine/putrescine transport system permease protein
MTSEAQVLSAPGRAEARSRNFLSRWWKNPWRKPRVLEAITWGYLAWSLLPVVIAILFSFNDGRSRSSWQGFSLQWWWVADPFDTEALVHRQDLTHAMLQSVTLSVATMLIAVPLGVLFAIGLDRWRGRGSGVTNFAMLFSFVIPEIILGVSLYLLFATTLSFLGLGTQAQIIGLVTFQISYPVIIVRARLLTIGKEYEEAAMDLGAKPTQAVRRILLPLLYPAIFASFAIVFADSIDDFVTVSALSQNASTDTLAMKIYQISRGSPTPAVNAAATVMLITTLAVIALGLLAYRRFSRGQSGAVGEFAQL